MTDDTDRIAPLRIQTPMGILDVFQPKGIEDFLDFGLTEATGSRRTRLSSAHVSALHIYLESWLYYRHGRMPLGRTERLNELDPRTANHEKQLDELRSRIETIEAVLAGPPPGPTKPGKVTLGWRVKCTEALPSDQYLVGRYVVGGRLAPDTEIVYFAHALQGGRELLDEGSARALIRAARSQSTRERFGRKFVLLRVTRKVSS